MTDPTKFMISIGDAFDGLTFIGPFDSQEDADLWADENVGKEEYHIVELQDKEAFLKNS